MNRENKVSQEEQTKEHLLEAPISRWILNLAAEEPFIVDFVGNLQPGSKDFGSNLEVSREERSSYEIQ